MEEINVLTAYTVERVFSVLKQHCAMGKVRYIALAHNRTRFEFMCVAYNLKRGAVLQQKLRLKNGNNR